MVELNKLMLRNLLDTVELGAKGLEHVNVMHGTKWYGNHLGPFRTSDEETYPPHIPPNFYYDQQAQVEDMSKGKSRTWLTARPHGICGFAIGNPMSLMMVIAAYGTISMALGLPLRHPGSWQNAHVLYNVIDSSLLARGCVWMSTETACANEPFNVTKEMFSVGKHVPIFAE